jgi:hypothetical protein
MRKSEDFCLPHIAQERLPPGLVAVGDAGLLPPLSRAWAPTRFFDVYVLAGEITRERIDIPGAGGV